VPPHKIGHLLRATFSNIEHQSIEYVTDTLMPWAVKWEQELDRKLLSGSERRTLHFEHLFDALLRGDALSRSQALEVQFRNGALTIDEWREMENRNPVGTDAGSAHWIMQNMATAEAQAAASEREPEPEPAASAEPEPEPAGMDESPADGEPAAIATGRPGQGVEAVTRAMLPVMAGQLQRLLAREVHEARRRAPDADVGPWYTRHAAAVGDAIAEPARALFALLAPASEPAGPAAEAVEDLISGYALRHCTDSQAGLALAADDAEARAALLRRWLTDRAPAAAAELVDEIAAVAVEPVGPTASGRASPPETRIQEPPHG